MCILQFVAHYTVNIAKWHHCFSTFCTLTLNQKELVCPGGLQRLCCWPRWLCCQYFDFICRAHLSNSVTVTHNYSSINLDTDQCTELTVSLYIWDWDFFYLKHSREIIVFTLQSKMIPCFIIYLDSISWASDQSEVHFPPDMWKFIWFVEVAVIRTAIMCDGLFFFSFFFKYQIEKCRLSETN